MRRRSYVTGALLSVCLTALAVGLIVAVGVGRWPRVVSLWPLLAALGASVVTWWLQGLIYAVLARPRLKGLEVGDMFRVEMAGLFVALDRKSTRLNSSHANISYAVFCLKKKKQQLDIGYVSRNTEINLQKA